MGLGHVTRCLALAEHLEFAGWRIGFAADETTWSSVAALDGRGLEALRLSAGPAGTEAEALKARWPGGAVLLVVDHYGRDRAFEAACRGWAERIVVIDDLCDRRHDASLLLDATPGRSASDYDGLVPDDALRLVGAAFAILRPEFRGLRGEATAALERAPERAERILVSLGGSDAQNLTGLVLEALAAIGMEIGVEVIVGAANPHREELARLARKLPFEVTVSADVRDMAARLLAADLVIGGLGTSALERCCLARPSVGLVVADNQTGNARALERAGAAAVVGLREAVTPAAVAAAVAPLLSDRKMRLGMAMSAAGLCDGLGAWRLICALAGTVTSRQGKPVGLRMADEGDSGLMYDWQCDPEVRKYSRNPQPPARARHERWLAECLADPGRVLTLLEVAGEPSGVLRLDLRDEAPRTFEVSILVAPGFQKSGVGQAALALARRLLPGDRFLAEVDPMNEASLGLFGRAGYRPISPHQLIQDP